MRSPALFSLCLLSGLAASGVVFAQGPDGPPPMPPMGSHDHGGPDGMGGQGRPEGSRGMGGPSVRHLLPPGIWWRQADLVQALSLSADQQKKMDDILEQSRIQLVHMKASLEEEQIRMEPMLDATPFDSGKVMGEVDKIAELRADLEKADARMLLGLRGVLTADQWTKLQAMRRAHQRSWEDGSGRRTGSGSHGSPQKNSGPGGPGDAHSSAVIGEPPPLA